MLTHLQSVQRKYVGGDSELKKLWKLLKLYSHFQMIHKPADKLLFYEVLNFFANTTLPGGAVSLANDLITSKNWSRLVVALSMHNESGIQRVQR